VFHIDCLKSAIFQKHIDRNRIAAVAGGDVASILAYVLHGKTARVVRKPIEASKMEMAMLQPALEPGPIKEST
jgi:hypothetical protein